MGVYTRADSPYYWLWLEREGRRGLARSTRIRADATTPELRRDNKRLADQMYHREMAALTRNELTPPPKPSIAFSAWADWYEENVIRTRANHGRELSMVECSLRPAFGHLELRAIDKEHVLEWRAARLAEVAPSTMDRELDVLKRMLVVAVPKYLDASPIAGMRRHRETLQSKKRRPRILEAGEFERLLAVARNDEERAIVILALDTVMRLSDVKNLRRDRHHGHFIHVEAPKIDPYDVELTLRAQEALAALPVRGPYYFTRRRSGKPSPIAASTVWRMFNRMCTDAGVLVGRKVRGVTFHSLRHTGTTQMLEGGANPIAVMEQGGWNSLRQLVRYGRASKESRRRAAELIPASSSGVVDDSKESPERLRDAREAGVRRERTGRKR